MKTPLRSRPSSGAPWAENGPGAERRSGLAAKPRRRSPLARPWKRRSPVRSDRPEGLSPGPTPEGHRSFGNRRTRERERLRFRQRRPTAEACPLAARTCARPLAGSAGTGGLPRRRRSGARDPKRSGPRSRPRRVACPEPGLGLAPSSGFRCAGSWRIQEVSEETDRIDARYRRIGRLHVHVDDGKGG